MNNFFRFYFGPFKHSRFSGIVLMIFFLLVVEMAKIQAQDMPQEVQQDDVFLPHMLDHKNEGCPTNSTCSPALGLTMKAWTNLLISNKTMGPKQLETLNGHIQKQGLPLEFWLAPAIYNEKVISWDSACESHRKEGREVDIGMVFAKGLSNMDILAVAPDIKTHLLLEQVFVQTSDQKLEIFPRLRGQMPIAFEQQQLVYIQDLEGVYWSLYVSQKGQLKMHPVPSTPGMKEVDCPVELLTFAKKHPPRQLIYESFFCKRLSNLAGDKHAVVMFPSACE